MKFVNESCKQYKKTIETLKNFTHFMKKLDTDILPTGSVVGLKKARLARIKMVG